MIRYFTTIRNINKFTKNKQELIKKIKIHLINNQPLQLMNAYQQLHQESNLHFLSPIQHSHILDLVTHHIKLEGEPYVDRKLMGEYIIQTMISRKIELSCLDYYNLFWLYFRSREYERVYLIMNNLINNNEKQWKNFKVLDIYIRILMLDFKFKEVLFIYNKALQAQVPNLALCELNVIEALGELNQFEESYRLFLKIKNKLDMGPYCSIVKSCIANNKTELILMIYEDALSIKKLPDLKFFEIILDFSYSQFDKEAVKFWLDKALKTPFVVFSQDQIDKYLS